MAQYSQNWASVTEGREEEKGRDMRGGSGREVGNVQGRREGVGKKEGGRCMEEGSGRGKGKEREKEESKGEEVRER